VYVIVNTPPFSVIVPEIVPFPNTWLAIVIEPLALTVPVVNRPAAYRLEI
jgi:hypothetical protein